MKFYFTIILFLFFKINLQSQTEVIFYENFGNPLSNTAFKDHTFQNAAPIYFSGDGDVRKSNPVSNYTNASGEGFAFFNANRTLIISGIKTQNYENLVLKMGHFKSSNASSNQLEIAVSSDSTNFTNLTYTRATGTGTSNWTYLIPSGTIPQTNTLFIRFLNTHPTTLFRVDDILLEGTLKPGLPNVISDLSDTIPILSNWSYNLITTNSTASVSVENLPNGLSFDNTTKVISGTPTQAGIFKIKITLQNALGTVERFFTLTVTCKSKMILNPTSGPPGTIVALVAQNSYFNLNKSSVSINNLASPFSQTSPNAVRFQIPFEVNKGLQEVVVKNETCISDSTFFNVLKDVNQGCQSEAPGVHSELFISELYDVTVGDAGYIEFYNPTTLPLNLDNYFLIRRDVIASPPFQLSGIIGANQVHVVNVQGSNACGLSVQGTYNSGFNANDTFDLYKNTVWIDRVVAPNKVGYNLQRRASAQAPKTQFDSLEWRSDFSEACFEHDLSSFNLNGKIAPVIKVQPFYNYTCRADSFSLKASVLEGVLGGFGLVYQWYRLDSGASTWQPLSDGTDFQGCLTDHLRVKNLKSKNQQQFYLEIRENNATCLNRSYAHQIDIKRNALLPDMYQKLADTMSLCQDNSIRLNVKADGAIFYSWSLNGVPIASSNRDSFIKANAQSSDFGLYVARAHQSSTCYDSSFTVVVASSPLSWQQQPAGASVLQGANHTLFGEIKGAITYQWFKDGVRIANATQKNYLISNANSNDIGCYTLKGYNSCGDSISSLCANIQIATVINCPKIQSWNVSKSGYCEGDSIVLNVLASDYDFISWYFNNQFIGQGDTLILKNVTLNQIGSYFAVAHPSNTTRCQNDTSSIFNIEVAKPPKLISLLNGSIYCVPKNHVFKIKAENAFRYNWFLDQSLIQNTIEDSLVYNNFSSLGNDFQVEAVGQFSCPSVFSNVVTIKNRDPFYHAIATQKSVEKIEPTCIDYSGYTYFSDKNQSDSFLLAIRNPNENLVLEPSINTYKSPFLNLKPASEYGFLADQLMIQIRKIQGQMKQPIDVSVFYNASNRSFYETVIEMLKEQNKGNIVFSNNNYNALVFLQSIDSIGFQQAQIPFEISNFWYEINKNGDLNQCRYFEVENIVFSDLTLAFGQFFRRRNESQVLNLNPNGNSWFSMYPNPAKEYVDIAVSLNTPEILSLRIYDVQGRKMSEKNLGRISKNEVIHLPLHDFSNGIYFLEMESNQIKSTQKLHISR